MSKVIRITKGLNISLRGQALPTIQTPPFISSYALKPLDFTGIIPKLLIKEGDYVKAGTPLFYDKENPQVMFTAPVSGTISAIRRGLKRVIEDICIEAEETIAHEEFDLKNGDDLTREKIIELMLRSGVWTFLRQRPYSIIANPQDTPKAILVSGFDTAPLAADYNIILQGQGDVFQKGLDLLTKLTEGSVFLNLHQSLSSCQELQQATNVVKTYFEGPHPAGNISVQARHLCPINRDDIIWYMNPQDVILLGRLFLEKRYNTKKIIALGGSEVENPAYFSIHNGACIHTLVDSNVKNDHVRYISGNPLTGTQISKDGYLGAYNNEISVLPEGDHFEFLGWLRPGLSKYSFSRTFLSGFLTNFTIKGKPVFASMLPTCCNPTKEAVIDTNMHGSSRAFVFTGDFEKVFPLDIYPLQLIKACIIEDIEMMEQLGIYEIDAEDFALCEFIDPSKTNIQSIIKRALNLMRKEMN